MPSPELSDYIWILRGLKVFTRGSAEAGKNHYVEPQINSARLQSLLLAFSRIMTSKILLIIVPALGLMSCTFPDGSHLVTGVARPAVKVEDVKLYFRPPAKFEEIAIVSASSKSQMAGDQRLMDAAIQRLKKEAAKVGANGVLFGGMTTGQAGGSVHTFGTSNTFSNASLNASGNGNAFNAYGTGAATSFNNAMTIGVPFVTKNTSGHAIHVIQE